MVDTNAIMSQVQGIATEQNIAMASETGGSLLDLAVKMVLDAGNLIQQNLLWAVVIVVLIKAEDMVIDRFGLPVPKGKIRWALLFFITMWASFLWVDLIGQWI